MASTTSHTRKRQYQPSLDSYFARNNEPSDLRRTTSLSPPVPADTQASLLSVGMRVRKSVPEGYKTHKTLGAGGIAFADSASPSSTDAHSLGTNSQPSRELMPFCGLHKTGGLAAQEIPASSAPARMRHDSDAHEDTPRLSMSQSTIYSTKGSFTSRSSRETNSRKRTYEEEADDEMDAFFDEMDAVDTLVGQTEAPPRPVARFKSSATARGGRRTNVEIHGEDDFAEASFLSPMEVDQ